jgi:hypothetical protein
MATVYADYVLARVPVYASSQFHLDGWRCNGLLGWEWLCWPCASWSNWVSIVRQAMQTA